MSAVSRFRQLLRFNLKTLLVLTALCAMAVGWHQDRQRLSNLRNAVLAHRAATTPSPGLARSVRQLVTFSTPTDAPIETVDEFIEAIRRTSGEPPFSDAILNLSIGQVYADESVPQIIELLKDKDETVRQRAVRALGSIARRSHIAVPALTQALHDESSDVSALAVHALSQFGERALPAVTDLMTIANADTSPNCAAAVYSILSIDPDAAIDKRLVAMLRHNDSRVRYMAAEAYSHAALTIDRIQPAVPSLIVLLDDENPEARSATVRALNRVPASTDVIDALAKALTNETDGNVRQCISRVLFYGGGGPNNFRASGIGF